ncbi:MAG TPA: amino acid adenylation domain-containing protein [Pyrinomonadaceae bacterium]|nr:amino acid adenylation domain-containing protein [Pyrinomonadaceae bacterium]
MTTEGLQLSPQQQHLWSLTRDDNGQCYQARCAVHLHGRLNRHALREAIEQVVKRHEILRTVFRVFPGLTMPVQVIEQNSPPPTLDIDLTSLSSDRQQVELRLLFQGMSLQPFTSQSPLSTSLVCLSETHHVLLISLAAACADSLTLDNLVRDLSRTYEACIHGEKLSDAPLQYADVSEVFNELLDSEETETGRSYWEQHDLLSLSRWRLPFEKEGPADRSFDPDFVAAKLDGDLFEKLVSFSQTFEISPSVLLLACWQILLRRLGAASDLTIGVSYDGRSYEGLSEALGLFARCLPIRSHIEDKQPLTHLLRELKRTTDEAQEWQDYFRLQRNSSRPEFEYFPYCFEFENSNPLEARGELTFSIAERYVRVDGFKLKLRCTQANSCVHIELHFDRSLYEPADAGVLIDQFNALMKFALDTPHGLISELEQLGAREREQILVEFNRTAVDYPQAQNIQQLFEEQSARTPQRVAVSFAENQFTFEEINARANQLAHHLRELGVAAEQRVGLYIERSAEMLIGVLGILKAGGCYVPLDPASPRERLKFIIEEASLSILVTQSSLVTSITGEQVRTVCLDANSEELEKAPATNLPHITTPQSLAYVIYTSGSTGRPKGVMVEHRSVINLSFGLRDTVYANATGPLRVGLNAPLIFDASVKQWVQLLQGHELHIVPEEVRADPARFVSFIERHKLSVFDCTPTQLKALLANWLGAKSTTRAHAPRLILVGGEEIDEANWRTLAASEDTTYFNVYGPTECTVDTTVCSVTTAPGQTSIGRPMPNVRVYILDENLKPVPIGVAGEICIGGAGVARGYIGKPALTAEAFIPNPFGHAFGERLYKTGDLARYLPDGRIKYLGRKDSQVKLSGYRIELKEIEAVVREHPAVRDAAVEVKQIEARPQIVAYVVLREGDLQPDTAGPAIEIRTFLRERLPEYMVPSAYVALPALPLTVNGKLDRARLPDPQKNAQALPIKYEAPRNHVQRTIASIWQEELHLEKIGIHDNFFDIGGSSLTMARVFDRLQSTFGNRLKMVELFHYPTINTLAKYLSQDEPETFRQTRVDQLVSRQKHARERQARARMR